MINYINPKTNEVFATDAELENLNSIEEFKTVLNTVYVGENNTMAVFNTYIKGETVIDKDDDEEEEDKYEFDGYAIIIVNKNDSDDTSMIYTHNRNIVDTVEIYDNILIIDSMPYIINNNYITQYMSGLGLFDKVYPEDEMKLKQMLNKVTNLKELEEACDYIDVYLSELENDN